VRVGPQGAVRPRVHDVVQAGDEERRRVAAAHRIAVAGAAAVALIAGTAELVEGLDGLADRVGGRGRGHGTAAVEAKLARIDHHAGDTRVAGHLGTVVGQFTAPGGVALHAGDEPRQAVQVVVGREAELVRGGTLQGIAARGFAAEVGAEIADVDLEVLDRQDREAGGPHAVVVATEIAPVAGAHALRGERVPVGDGAVGLGARPGELEHRPVRAQRATDERAVILALVAADGDRGVGTPLGGGLFRDVVDGAGEGVATIERALRALEDLDALDVGQTEVEHRLVRQIHAVVEHRHVLRAVGELRVGQATQHQAAREARGHVALVVEARRAQRDVCKALDVAALDLLGGEGVDDQRDVLQRLLALARGDGDLVEHRRARGVPGLHRLCAHGGRQGGAERDRDGEGNRSVFHLADSWVGRTTAVAFAICKLRKQPGKIKNSAAARRAPVGIARPPGPIIPAWNPHCSG